MATRERSPNEDEDALLAGTHAPAKHTVEITYVRAGDEPSMRPRQALETARRGSDVLLTRRSRSSHLPRTASVQTCPGRPSSLWSAAEAQQSACHEPRGNHIVR